MKAEALADASEPRLLSEGVLIDRVESPVGGPRLHVHRRPPMRTIVALCIAAALLPGGRVTRGAERASGGPSRPPLPPTRAALLEASLRTADARYDPDVGFLRAKGGGPGYHTRTSRDQTVHNVLDTAGYAQLLLMRGAADDVARASGILRRLVDLQVTDPSAKHYGLWGWFVEEPPERMAPADWNWADFVGARLAEILHGHAGRLDPALATRMRESLGHATRCIRNRNVGPGYTNICTMGAAVTMAAGEMLGEPDLLGYGRRRLADQRAELERNGGVPEYNSPPYGIIMIQELERILRLVKDPSARSDADWMRRRMWELNAGQFHPGTGQWSGAQSRTYGRTLHPNQALFLWLRAGVVPRGAESMAFTAGPDMLHVDEAPPCPAEFVGRFARLPADPHELTQLWMQATQRRPPVSLHTWFSAAATLGTINEETTWVQHRVLTGFWPDGTGGVASLGLALLKDGREFASGIVRARQQGPRVLAVLGMAAGQGDWHVSLDRPADGSFTAGDLRLRIWLDAPDARFAARSAGGWVLSSGSHEVFIHPGEVFFDGRPGSWEAGRHEGGVHLDAVLHAGVPLRFSPAMLGETAAGFGLELLPAGRDPVPAGVSSARTGDHRGWSWSPVAGEILAPVGLRTGATR